MLVSTMQAVFHVISEPSPFKLLFQRIVVYSPQIVENYQLQSGEGLSVFFVVIWLLGDLCNLAGALMAGLLPTVILLAIYVSRGRPFFHKIPTESDFRVLFTRASIRCVISSFCLRFTGTDGNMAFGLRATFPEVLSPTHRVHESPCSEIKLFITNLLPCPDKLSNTH